MKTIAFDFGNVLAHFDHRITVAKLLPFTTLSADELLGAIYNGPVEVDYECGRLSTEGFFQAIRLPSKLTCSLVQFVAAFEDIFAPNPDVCELIPLLKPRYRLLLASNTNAAHYAKYSAQLASVLAHFDALCPSHLIGHRKPSADYFAGCQSHASAEPGECLFIDDLPENLDAARRHGWHGLLYGPSTNLREQLRGMGILFDAPLR